MDYYYNMVNQKAAPFAPTQGMQFGTALQPILQCLVNANPSYGPLILAKIDLANGYYRVLLSPEAALELAILLPPDAGGAYLIGIPLSLPMDWGHSPPYYCAFTEKGADVANASIATPIPLQFHHSEANTQMSPFPLDCTYAPTASLPFNLLLPAPPLAYTDVSPPPSGSSPSPNRPVHQVQACLPSQMALLTR
jgi:hypothetical protein